MPWVINDRLEALVLGGVQEFVASWLAKDRNQYCSYFTGRIPKMAFYNCFVGVPIGEALGWLVFKLFEGCTSLEAQLLQIVISNITVRSGPPHPARLALLINIYRLCLSRGPFIYAR